MPEQQPNPCSGPTVASICYGAVPGPLTVRVNENAALTEMAAGLITVGCTWRAAPMPARYGGSFFERESHARTKA